ncbi:MAG: hypothetical protein JW874_09900 [Spirochaetales bacterium]|nr:hypothetical protein [Spirochaetales bacterium]
MSFINLVIFIILFILSIAFSFYVDWLQNREQKPDRKAGPEETPHNELPKKKRGAA